MWSQKTTRSHQCGFCKVAEYNVSTQKSFASFTVAMKNEIEIKESISFTVTSKRIKHWDYTYVRKQDHNMLKKEIKDNTNIWKDVP